MMKKRYNARKVTRQVLRKAFLEVQGMPVAREMDAVELSRRLCLLTEAQVRAVAIPDLRIVPSTNTAWSYDILFAQIGQHDVGIDDLSSAIMRVIEERGEQQVHPVLTEPITQDDPLFAKAHAILEQIWQTSHLAIDVFQQTPRRASSAYVVLCYSQPDLTVNVAAEDLLPTLRALQEQVRMQAGEVVS